MTESPLSENLVGVAAFKQRMIEDSGGAMTAVQVRDLLGYKGVEAVEQAVADRRMLAVDDNGTSLFPAFQFEENTLRFAMARILAAVPNTSAWALLQYLVAGDEGLEPRKPIDLLKGSPEDIDLVVRFARALEA
jgi:hypothetical protein